MNFKSYMFMLLLSYTVLAVMIIMFLENGGLL